MHRKAHGYASLTLGLLLASGGMAKADMPEVELPAAEAAPAEQLATPLNYTGDALPLPDLSPYQNELLEMQRLQRDNVLLKLQVEQAQLQASLKQTQGSGTPLKLSGEPTVLTIGGVGNRRSARLSIPGHGEVVAKVSQRLPNDWQVTRISDQGVDVKTHDGRQVRLPFYVSAQR